MKTKRESALSQAVKMSVKDHSHLKEIYKGTKSSSPRGSVETRSTSKKQTLR